jgi:hypothetical protein
MKNTDDECIKLDDEEKRILDTSQKLGLLKAQIDGNQTDYRSTNDCLATKTQNDDDDEEDEFSDNCVITAEKHEEIRRKRFASNGTSDFKAKNPCNRVEMNEEANESKLCYWQEDFEELLKSGRPEVQYLKIHDQY